MKKFLITIILILSLVLGATACGERPSVGNGDGNGDGNGNGNGNGNTTYTVTYKANAADAVFIDTEDNEDIVYSGIAPNSALTAPAVRRTGYFLNGWGLVQDNPRVDIWNFTTNKVNSNLTLYAAWLKLHTITFDYTGGELVSGDTSKWSVKIVDGELLNNTHADFPVVEKEGAIFSGWYTDSGFQNRWDFYRDTVTTNVKLYAKFSTLTQSTSNPLYSYIPDDESESDSLMIAKFNHEQISSGKDAYVLSIPSELDGKAVTALGDRVFVPETINTGTEEVPILVPAYQISSIVMPDSIERMGIEVFMFNDNITSITLSQNLTRLGDYAFSGNRFRTWGAIDFSAYTNLTEIGDGAFMQTGIESVVLPANLAYLGEHVFDKCSDLTWVTYAGCVGWNASTMALRLPSTLTRLGEYAFASTELTGTVDIGNLTGLETLERSLFFFNGKITSAVLPEGIEGIGTCMFQDAAQLKSVNIPSTVKTIGNWVLYGTAVEFDEANPLVIPDGVNKLGEWNFGKTPNMTCIVLPSTITSMGTYNFDDWTPLMKVKVKGLTERPSNWPTTWSGGQASIIWGFAG